MRRLEDRIFAGMLGAMLALGAVNVTFTGLMYRAQTHAQVEAEGRMAEFRSFREEIAHRISESAALHQKFVQDIEALRGQVAADRAVLNGLSDKRR